MDEVVFDQCMRGLDDEGQDRFLGASDGISVKDKAIIDRHTVLASSHPGYDRSLSVFPLPRDRVAIMYTFRTTDGSRPWPFNHVLVTSLQEYGSLSANPFVVLDKFCKDHRAARRLDPIHIDPREREQVFPEPAVPQPDLSKLPEDNATFEALLNSLLAASYENPRGPTRLYVFFSQRNDALVEALLLCLPAHVRARLSFTTCLTELEEKSAERVREGIVSWPEESPEDYEIKWCLVPIPDSEQRARFLEGVRARNLPFIDLTAPRLTGEGFHKHAYAERFVELRGNREALGDLLTAADNDNGRRPLRSIAEDHRKVQGVDDVSNDGFERLCRDLVAQSSYFTSSLLPKCEHRITWELHKVIAGESPNWLRIFLRQYTNLAHTHALELAGRAEVPSKTAQARQFVGRALTRLLDAIRRREGGEMYCILLDEVYERVKVEAELLNPWLEEFKPFCEQRLRELLVQETFEDIDLKELDAYIKCYPQLVVYHRRLVPSIVRIFRSPSPTVLEKASNYIDTLTTHYTESIRAIKRDPVMSTAVREERLAAKRNEFLAAYSDILESLLDKAPQSSLCGRIMAECLRLRLKVSRKKDVVEFISENIKRNWSVLITGDVIHVLLDGTLDRWTTTEAARLFGGILNDTGSNTIAQIIIKSLLAVPSEREPHAFRLFKELFAPCYRQFPAFRDPYLVTPMARLAVAYYGRASDGETRKQALVRGGRELAHMSWDLHEAYLTELERGDFDARSAALQLRAPAQRAPFAEGQLSFDDGFQEGQRRSAQLGRTWTERPQAPCIADDGFFASLWTRFKGLFWGVIMLFCGLIIGYMIGRTAASPPSGRYIQQERYEATVSSSPSGNTPQAYERGEEQSADRDERRSSAGPGTP